MNVRAALACGRERLRADTTSTVAQVAAGATPGIASETPALDAEVLLRHVLQLDRAHLFTALERALTTQEQIRYRQLLDRRAAGEPIAYLTGRREFMGLEFHVDRRVLIPRPDTEVLVERALEIIRTKFRQPAPNDGERSHIWVADVGTGSGAIATSIATLAGTPHRSHLSVVATDISWNALVLARENARRLASPEQWVAPPYPLCPQATPANIPQPPPMRSPSPNSPHFIQCALLRGISRRFDVILANLPYIRREDMETLPVTVRAFEPRGALDGGPDGLAHYRLLLHDASAYLAPGGVLLMECDPQQVKELLALGLRSLPDAAGTVHRDLAGLDRVVEIARGAV